MNRKQARQRAIPRQSPVVPIQPKGSPAGPPGLLQNFVERSAPEVVAFTYWFNPLPEPAIQSVTIRFTGWRLDESRSAKPGDEFSHDEKIDGILAGSGPIAVTVKIRDVNPGEWTVHAQLLTPEDSPKRKRRTLEAHSPAISIYPASWSWLRWRLTANSNPTVKTRLAPFVRPPGVLLGSWAALVALGTVLALLAQALIISAKNLQLEHVLAASLLILLGGVVGAKTWYLVLHRRDGSRDGWAVQGFVAGFALVAPVLLTLFKVPTGVFLDATTPGLMLGLAVGRLGCFFTGCCAGRPSASRWAVWSSNRSIGARRVPTQLMESALAFAVALIAFVVILRYGTQHGRFFVAALAGYTLVRQGLLRLREERRQSNYGASLVAAAAALTLVADLAVMVWA